MEKPSYFGSPIYPVRQIGLAGAMAAPSRLRHLDGRTDVAIRPISGTSIKSLILACLFALFSAPALAQTDAAAKRSADRLSFDCTEISFDYFEESVLTREVENIIQAIPAFRTSRCSTTKATT